MSVDRPQVESVGTVASLRSFDGWYEDLRADSHTGLAAWTSEELARAGWDARQEEVDRLQAERDRLRMELANLSDWLLAAKEHVAPAIAKAIEERLAGPIRVTADENAHSRNAEATS